MAQAFKFNWDTVKEDIKKEDDKKDKKFSKDERFWTPTKDANGIANAVIRFIPDAEGNPFAKIYNHGFAYQVNGQKKWWIRNCLNTFGYDRDCPICKKNMELWNSAFESDKAIASKRKRKLQYIANIIVIKNPACPEEEGKVFLYKFGAKIYDKIKQKMFPSETDLMDEDFKQFVPFDLYEGADFILAVTKQGEFPNYDNSKFTKQKPLVGGDDKKIGAVMETTHLISPFLAESEFPSNEETLRSLAPVLCLSDEEVAEEKPKAKKEAKPKEDEPEEISEGSIDISDDSDTPEEKSNDEEEEEDDDLAFFNSLKK